MSGFELGEVVSLGFDLLMFPILMAILVKGEIPRFRFIAAAAACILFNHFATVLEAFYLPTFFNLAEHFAILLSGIFFLAAFFRYAFFKQGNK